MEKDVARFCAAKDVKSIKERMSSNRKSAYDKEDKVSEAIPAAIKKGITGKGWKDFLPDADFKKALSDWEDALKVQQELVKSLEDVSAQAKKRFAEMNRLLDTFEKDMKKEGQSEKANKLLKKTLTRARALMAELETSKDSFGTLKAKDAFFGANLKKSRDVVVSKALKSGSGDELPDILLENPKRQQTDNKVKRLHRNIEKHTKLIDTLCAADKFAVIPSDIRLKKGLEKDVQTAKAALKQASDHLKNLKDINKELQGAKKKQAKLIAAHNEKAKMNGLIKTVEDLAKSGEEAFSKAEDRIDDAATAL